MNEQEIDAQLGKLAAQVDEMIISGLYEVARAGFQLTLEPENVPNAEREFRGPYYYTLKIVDPVTGRNYSIIRSIPTFQAKDVVLS